MAGLGLSGAHRTGKTTLAQKYAQENDIVFVRTSGSEVFAMLGKDPKAEYPIGERLAIQEAILTAFTKQYQEAERRGGDGGWISDRTPIDLASYMLADVQRSTVNSPEVAALVNNYVERCMKVASDHFAAIILVQPGIQTVEEQGKAQACPAYMEHLNLLQRGMLADGRLNAMKYFIPRKYTSLQQRIDCIERVCDAVNEFHDQIIAKRDESGTTIH